jgi:DNA-binding XRE family transcriptional regulator
MTKKPPIIDLARIACAAYDPSLEFESLTSEDRFKWVKVADAVRLERKGRGKRLTWVQVCEIRESYKSGACTQRQLAAEYGVSQNTVGEIVRSEIRENS